MFPLAFEGAILVARGELVKARRSWTKVLVAFLILDLVVAGVAYGIYRYVIHVSPSGDIRTGMRELERSIDLYYADCKAFPTEDQGLDALRYPPAKEPHCLSWDGPYAEGTSLMDPWGRTFIYLRDGDFFSLKSLGADGQPGGSGINADLVLEDL